jgi:rRNA maturation endonuclease Nob1
MAVCQTITILHRGYKPRKCWNCDQTYDGDKHNACPYCGSPKQKPPQG